MSGSMDAGVVRGSRAVAFALVCLLVASGASVAAPARYVLDPVHTRVLVVVDHAGYSSAMGTVSGSEGTLVFDPEDWHSARLDVSVPLARLDFGDAGWNAAVGRMLGVADHPVARFQGDRVEAVDEAAARVCGRLTLNGTTRPLCLDVRANRLARHRLPPFRVMAGFSATATLRRSDFGIDAWPRTVGDTVTLRIEAEARHAGPLAEDGQAAQDRPSNGEATR